LLFKYSFHHGAMSWCVVVFLSLSFISGRDSSAGAYEAEVVHWWFKSGDARALRTLIHNFERRGGIWIDAAEADFYMTRERVVSRLAKGYPPTAIQWNAGIEVVEFAQLGLLNPIKDAQQRQQLEQQSYSTIIDQVTVDGEIIAVPINVHNESWMWANESVLRRAKVNAPASFQDIQSIVPALGELGVTPLAVGAQAWQQRILFMNVLLAQVGRAGFEQLLIDLNAEYLNGEEFSTVVETFTSLSKHARSFGDGSWTDQVKAVRNGDAALLFMGDWAKGEFLAMNAELGIDFFCHPAPGVDYLQPVIDVFMLGGSDDPAEIAAQRVYVDTLLDKDTVVSFNRIKGSVPPFPVGKDYAPDACESGSLDLLKERKKTLPPFASLGDGRHAGLIQEAIRILWSDGPSGWVEARALFAEAIDHEKARRNSRGKFIVSGVDD